MLFTWTRQVDFTDTDSEMITSATLLDKRSKGAYLFSRYFFCFLIILETFSPRKDVWISARKITNEYRLLNRVQFSLRRSLSYRPFAKLVMMSIIADKKINHDSRGAKMPVHTFIFMYLRDLHSQLSV